MFSKKGVLKNFAKFTEKTLVSESLFKSLYFYHFVLLFNCLNFNLKKGQTHSNNSSATANELFDFVWPFWGVGA